MSHATPTPGAAAAGAGDPADLGVLEAARELRARRLSRAELTDAVLAPHRGAQRRRADVRRRARRGQRVGARVPRAGARDGPRRRRAARARRRRRAAAVRRSRSGSRTSTPSPGLPVTASSRMLEGNVASEDSVVWARLRAAGMVLVGHTHTHEFAFGGTTDQVGNPWDLARSAGGSSGGSAAALAARMVPAATGTDTAGSVRIPAAMSGISAIKPTHGRVPIARDRPARGTLDHAGPMARSLADCSALLAVMADGRRRVVAADAAARAARPDAARAVARAAAARRAHDRGARRPAAGRPRPRRRRRARAAAARACERARGARRRAPSARARLACGVGARRERRLLVLPRAVRRARGRVPAVPAHDHRPPSATPGRPPRTRARSRSASRYGELGALDGRERASTCCSRRRSRARRRSARSATRRSCRTPTRTSCSRSPGTRPASRSPRCPPALGARSGLPVGVSLIGPRGAEADVVQAGDRPAGARARAAGRPLRDAVEDLGVDPPLHRRDRAEGVLEVAARQRGQRLGPRWSSGGRPARICSTWCVEAQRARRARTPPRGRGRPRRSARPPSRAGAQALARRDRRRARRHARPPGEVDDRQQAAVLEVEPALVLARVLDDDVAQEPGRRPVRSA